MSIPVSEKGIKRGFSGTKYLRTYTADAFHSVVPVLKAQWEKILGLWWWLTKLYAKIDKTCPLFAPKQPLARLVKRSWFTLSSVLETPKAIITEAANIRESDWFKHYLCIRCEDKFCSDLPRNALLWLATQPIGIKPKKGPMSITGQCQCRSNTPFDRLLFD